MNWADIMLWLVRAVMSVIGVYSLYNLWISLPLLLPYKTPQGNVTPYHRIAVVTSARNEEKVIANLIDSLRRQDYPKAFFEIFVIADNCDDQTADIARRMGCKVLERKDPLRRTKGYALQWFFSRFSELEGENYSHVCILDADNVLTPTFLSEMNRQINRGERVICGRRIGKNPDSSVLAGCNSLFWAFSRRSYDRPRVWRGMSLTSVGGTGYIFELDLISRRGWQAETMVEDIEFALNMVLKGIKVAYCDRAVFYDEQPTTLKATYKQRCRWTYGTYQIMKLKAWPLLKQVFKGRFSAFDGFVYAMGPLILMLTPLLWVVWLTLETYLSGYWMTAWQMIFYGMASSQLIMSCYAFCVIKLERLKWRGEWKTVLLFPLYTFLTMLIILRAPFVKKPVWDPIEHNDAQSIRDVEHGL